MKDKTTDSGERGDVRAMTARWVVTARMRLKTASHFGGEGDSAVDMAVLRDAKDGRPLLPGASLAGALRGHLADVYGGYRSDEDREVAGLFGVERQKDEGAQSPLIVFDSLGEVPEGMTVEIRDGVAIDSATGTAKPHKKFDFEVLPAGTVFPLRVDLIIEDSASEPAQLGRLVTALDGLDSGDIALGMRRSRGMGSIEAGHWRARRFDLSTQQGWLDWLTTDHLNPLRDDVQSHESPLKAIRASQTGKIPMELPDKRDRILVDLALKVAGDLLVRSPGCDPAAPDSVHLRSAGRPVLPGTGLAGVLRAQAQRIAWLVRESAADAEQWVDRLFGAQCSDEDERADAQMGRSSASKLRISESFLEGSDPRRQARIAIDRFTGGVVQGALFDEQVEVGGSLKVRLELRNPTDGESGLLLLLVKDLLSGNIPVGGEASVGRGVLKGSARIRLNGDVQYEIRSDLSVEEEARKFFDTRIRAFHEAEILNAQEVRS
ncbi:RAMP superfamily CRISPR-associated protein [Desulfatiglans anilini]|uniref:RAMP superfamily CRISPR-associated protein n=1 Tax=Desulfatiglans anilini TaxID=90728 RepID=UPI0003F7C599|nr:RAMP superfamily CRISPR-associated protein [Desulfatiglans anilini]